jgi:Zn-dependent M28 family amino/carboxypeptidase
VSTIDGVRGIASFTLAFALSFLGPRPAPAADVPIPAKVAIVKAAKLVKVLSKTATTFPLPAPGSAADPTLAGATLHFFDTENGGGGEATFTLDASGWKGLGDPAGSRGYKYKGKDDGNDPDPKGTCKIVLLKQNTIKAVCKGAAVTLSTPFASTAGALLGLPAGSTALRYCAEAGGEEKKNDAGGVKRKDAPAPPSCPEPPSVPFVGFDPNDVVVLADDSMNGRNNNTAGSAAAQAFLIAELQEMGAAGLNSSESGDDAYKQPYVRSGNTGTNILAVLPGGELPDEYVMAGAHYDHLGSCASLEAGDFVCNGATDNAAGAAAVLAIGRAIAALPQAPRRSVILALWDSEEDGLIGSAHYVDNPLVPLEDTIAYINFDIQGANLLPSLRNHTFAVGSESGGAPLRALLDETAGDSSLEVRALSFLFGQGRSDYVNLFGGGVPTVFFSDSTGGCYHTNQDEVAVVDFAKLYEQSRNGFQLTLALAETSTPPVHTTGTPLATFADAAVIDEVLTLGLADLALFSPLDQATIVQIQAEIAQIVAGGEANFDPGDVGTLLNDVLQVVGILTNIDCDGFL